MTLKAYTPPEPPKPIPQPVIPPPPDALAVPRVAWNPPRRLYAGTGDKADYKGHYRPSQFMPNYGDELESEVAKARSYYQRNLEGKDGYPQIQHNRIQRPFPVHAGPLNRWQTILGGSANGDFLYSPTPPKFDARANLRDPQHQANRALAGSAPGIVAIPSIPSSPEELEKDREMPKSRMEAINAIRPGSTDFVNPDDPAGLQHEMRHAWTVDDPEQIVFGSGIGSRVSDYHPGASHGLSKVEQLGWLSGLQHELYGQRGKRLESPEEAETYLREMINLPEEEFEGRVKGFKSDADRGMRHLRYLRHGIPDALKGSGVGQVDPSPTVKQRVDMKRFPDWMWPIGGEEIPFTGRDIEFESPYSEAEKRAPDVLEQYIQWLSKLAPALVSTQTGEPNIMKTASHEPTDMTKEADIGQLLSGLGNQTMGFINNMPNNPMWQNGLAGGGGAALLMLLLNLITGNRLGRGLFPATLAGGALGMGMPAFYNYMNRPHVDENAPVEVHGPPKPIPQHGPPAPNQMIDATGQIRYMTPLQMRQRERHKNVAPGTLKEMFLGTADKLDQWNWAAGAPARGIKNRIDETAENVKKLGLVDGIGMIPTTDTFKDPYDAEKYSAPDFR